ncbi:helix-turn-helix domain-containing protein [Morganella psychrotolerans]|uniref:helix-turn-helix domain-containing protein n=1 Tax=Morganella psychrotolerans TaxID=368603 RepID=UPI0039B11513
MTGFELRLWRKGLNFTQEQAAAMFGLTRRTWNRYERNNPPKIVDMAIIALSLTELKSDLYSSTGRKLSKQIEILITEIQKISVK